jgi:threonyl-tRNA synthetase
MAEAGVEAKMAALGVDPVADRKPYYEKRIDLFSKYAEREKAQVEAARAAGAPIKVVLPDASIRQGIKGATTPLDIANEISKSLAKKCVVAKVDGQTWDLFRPLEGDCALQLLSFEDADGREVRRQGSCWAPAAWLPMATSPAGNLPDAPTCGPDQRPAW